jgi:acyl dehydratase
VALNAALLGKAYPSLHYEVGREKLREFAAAVGETDPLYHDLGTARAAGFADLPAVPTFPVVLSLRAATAAYEDPELGVDFARVVHGEQEFTYERPVVAGDRLTATPTVVDVRSRGRSRGRHETLTIETSIRTEDGEAVCTARSTVVIRGAEPPPEGQAVAAAEAAGAPVPAGEPG